VISYREVLELFFAFYDPTTLNRQGVDVGTQYRSAIFYHSPEQKQTAEALTGERRVHRPLGRGRVPAAHRPGSTEKAAAGSPKP
jgi:peptide-methionine (S)-S-oxide reductase